MPCCYACELELLFDLIDWFGECRCLVVRLLIDWIGLEERTEMKSELKEIDLDLS